MVNIGYDFQTLNSKLSLLIYFPPNLSVRAKRLEFRLLHRIVSNSPRSSIPQNTNVTHFPRKIIPTLSKLSRTFKSNMYTNPIKYQRIHKRSINTPQTHHSFIQIPIIIHLLIPISPSKHHHHYNSQPNRK